MDKLTVNDIIQNNKQKLEKENAQQSVKFSRRQPAPEQQEMVAMQEEAIPAVIPKQFSTIPPPPNVLQETDILPGSQQPEVDDDPFDDDPFDDVQSKPPITIGEVIPQLQTQPLQDLEGDATPEFSAVSPSYAQTSPVYNVATPQPDIGYTEQTPTVAPAQPAVKATIEVPAGQQGQFTISSSSPPPEAQAPEAKSPEVPVEETALENISAPDIVGKEPVAVVKKDEPSSGGSDNTKTIKILEKIE